MAGAQAKSFSSEGKAEIMLEGQPPKSLQPTRQLEHPHRTILFQERWCIRFAIQHLCPTDACKTKYDDIQALVGRVDRFARQVDLSISWSSSIPNGHNLATAPGIFLQYISTCKVSASYLLYIRTFFLDEIKNGAVYIKNYSILHNLTGFTNTSL